MKHRFLCLFFSIFIFFPTLSAAQNTVEASVDTSRPSVGESFRLTVKNAEGSGTPNYNVLENNFRITGRNQAYQTTYINGVSAVSSSVIITLVPKKEGTFKIPPFKFKNGSTGEIRIEVGKASSTYTPKQPSAGRKQASADAPELSIKSAILEETGYEHSQFLYYVRIYDPGIALDLNVAPPNAQDILIERLGEAETYLTMLEGRQYRVWEQKFVLFPQKSGTFTIPPVRATATVSTPTSSILDDDFMSFGFGRGLFQTTRNISVESDPLTIKALPRPSDWKGKTWTPATRLTASAKPMNSKTKINLGEPFSFETEIRAFGVLPSSLPDVTLPESSDYRLYPSPEKTEKLESQTSLVSEKKQEFSVIFSTPGKKKLPPISIDYFNPETKKKETVRLDLGNVEVVADSSYRPETPKPPAEKQESVPLETTAEEKMEIPRSPLLLFGTGFVCAFILAAILFKRKAKKPAPTAERFETDVREGKLLKDVERACLKNSARDSAEALLAYGKFRNPAVLSLSDLQAFFPSKELAVEVGKLQNALYSPVQTDWRGEPLWRVLKKSLGTVRSGRKKAEGVPSLYPDLK